MSLARNHYISCAKLATLRCKSFEKLIMSICCICQKWTQHEANIFEEQIGTPPVFIVDLLRECTHEYIQDEHVAKTIESIGNNQSSICMQCSTKLLKYYKALIIIKKIEHHFFMSIRKSNIRAMLQQTLESGTDFKTSVPKCNADKCINIEVLHNGDYIIEAVNPFEDTPTTLETACANVFNCDKEDALKDMVDNADCKNSTKSMFAAMNCIDCNVEFATIRNYNAHQRKCHFEGYICEQCGKTYYSKAGLRTHIESHKPVKAFVCTDCGKGYHSKFSFQKHIVRHSGEMPHVCDICSKRFVHKFALQTHKRIHDDNRRMQCNICGFKLRTKAHLKRHMLTHTKIKPHSCPICAKCFALAYNLKAHIREHENPGSTRKKRYNCTKCGKRFVNDAILKEHYIQMRCVEDNK